MSTKNKETVLARTSGTVVNFARLVAAKQGMQPRYLVYYVDEGKSLLYCGNSRKKVCSSVGLRISVSRENGAHSFGN